MMVAMEGYQNQVWEKIEVKETWPELFHSLYNFLQKPSVFITIILITVLAYLCVQNGSMQKELNSLYQKLQAFEKKGDRMTHDMKDMDS